MWQLPDGRIVKQPPRWFKSKDGTVNHPGKNLLYWKPDTMKKMGVKYVVEAGKFDDTLYKQTGYNDKYSANTNTITRTYTSVPIYSVAQLKEGRINIIKKQAKELYREAIFELEFLRDVSFATQAEIDSWVNYKENVKQLAQDTIQLIKNTNVYDNIKEIQWSWPARPDNDSKFIGV
jgi:hypothetical protein